MRTIGAVRSGRAGSSEGSVATQLRRLVDGQNWHFVDHVEISIGQNCTLYSAAPSQKASSLRQLAQKRWPGPRLKNTLPHGPRHFLIARVDLRVSLRGGLDTVLCGEGAGVAPWSTSRSAPGGG
jgi:hypothetical protein